MIVCVVHLFDDWFWASIVAICECIVMQWMGVKVMVLGFGGASIMYNIYGLSFDRH